MGKLASVESAANSILAMLPNTFGQPDAWREVIANCAKQADVGHCMISMRNENLDFEFDDEFWLSPFMHGYCEQMSIPYRDHARHYDHWNEFEKNLAIGEIAIASQSIPEHDINPNPFSDWLEFAGFNDSAVSMLGMIDKSHLAISFNFKTDKTDIERVEQLLAIISRPISLALRADMLGAASGSARAVLSYAEHFDRPVFILEQDAKLLDANRLAKELLNSHEAFYKPYGKIGLTHSNRNHLLVSMVNDTINTGQTNYLRIDDGCSCEPLMALITPSPCPKSYIGRQRSIAVVTITSPRREIPFLAPLVKTHNITPVQLSLLETFSKAESYAEVARIHNIDAQRVREIFAEIYQRLGIKGQRQLIRLLEQLPRHST